MTHQELTAHAKASKTVSVDKVVLKKGPEAIYLDIYFSADGLKIKDEQNVCEKALRSTVQTNKIIDSTITNDEIVNRLIERRLAIIAHRVDKEYSQLDLSETVYEIDYSLI